MELKDKIISQSLLLFIKSGVRSVNMDEVSSNLGISKKTLYLHVNNKADLVFQVFGFQCEVLKESFSVICQKEKNAIDELYEMDEKISFLFHSMNPTLISELKKYYNESWELVENLKQSFLFELIESNIEKGIKQKLYRDDLNAALISKLFINRSEYLLDGHYIKNQAYDLRETLKDHRIYHVRGIASLVGLKYLEEKLEIW
jgi:AcrR family transcriptional regulator